MFEGEVYDDIYNENYMQCPYCEHVEQDTFEMINVDGNEHEIECSACEKTYKCYAEETITYHSIPDCGLLGLEHQLYLFTSNTGRSAAFCERCSACIESGLTEARIEEIREIEGARG